MPSFLRTSTQFRGFRVALLGACVACAKTSGPLPGDSVSSDGAVALTPARANLAEGTRDAREPVGAIERRLFPPELVMEHQAKIALLPSQREAIAKEVERGQKEILRLQWDLQAEKEQLVLVLDASRVDEAKVNEVASRVTDREAKVKASHLGMLVRVKNLLTPQQQHQLQDARDGTRCMPSSPDGGT